MITKTSSLCHTLTSGIQVHRDGGGLVFSLGVVPPSVGVLPPHLRLAHVQPLVLQRGGVDPQPVGDGRHAVHAHLTAVGEELGHALVGQGGHRAGGLRHGEQCGGVRRVSFGDERLRDRPSQPQNLHLGGAGGCHGDVAEEGDSAASFEQRAARELGHSWHQHFCREKT